MGLLLLGETHGKIIENHGNPWKTTCFSPRILSLKGESLASSNPGKASDAMHMALQARRAMRWICRLKLLESYGIVWNRY